LIVNARILGPGSGHLKKIISNEINKIMQFEFEKLVESILNEISQPFTGHDDPTKRAMTDRRYVPGREAGGSMMSQSEERENNKQDQVMMNILGLLQTSFNIY